MHDVAPFHWDLRSDGIQFAIDRTGIEQVRDDLSVRGAHARGLLLALVTGSGADRRYVVTDCLPLGQADDPSHDLLSSCKAMEDEINRWRAASLPVPAGVYAHHTGDIADFERQEFSKIRAYLTGGTDFLICLQMTDLGAVGEIAAVGPRNGIVARAPFVIALDGSAAFNPGLTDDIRAEFRAAAARISEGPRLITVPDPVKPKAGRHRFLQRWVRTGTAGGFVILIAAGLWWASHSHRPATTQGQAPGDIGLRVIRKGGELEITWNTNSPSARAAHTAVMRVKDGSRETELPLDANDRKNGHIVYTPRSGDVDVRVEFMSAGKTVGAGSVRVLNALQGKSPEPAPAAKPAAEPRVASANARPSPFAPKSPEPKRAVPETQRARVSAPAPVPSARPAISAERPPNPPENTPPVPLENAPVSVPANLRAAITADIMIPVHVTVDEHGRVTDARVDPVRDALSRELAAIALEAAKRWQFKPATRGGEPVSSPYILNFRFRR